MDLGVHLDNSDSAYRFSRVKYEGADVPFGGIVLICNRHNSLGNRHRIWRYIVAGVREPFAVRVCAKIFDVDFGASH